MTSSLNGRFPLLSLLPENFETQQQCSVSFQILEKNGKGDNILKSSILKSLGWMHISVTWWPLLDLSSVRLVPASRRIFWGMQKLNWIMFPSPDLSDYKLDLLFSITSYNLNDTDFTIKCPLNESRYVSKSIQVQSKDDDELVFSFQFLQRFEEISLARDFIVCSVRRSSGSNLKQ